MLTRKCLAVLLLVVATNFSQSFAAPSLENGNLDETQSAPVEDATPLQPAVEDASLNGLDGAENFTPSTPLEDSQAIESEQVENFSAPSQLEDKTQSVSAADDGAFTLQPSTEDTIPKGPDDAEIYAAEKSGQEAAVAAEPYAASETTAGVPQNLLTKEEEDELLKKIPDFGIIMKSIEELPADVYADIKEFLQKTLPRMPHKNLVTLHFQNAFVLTQLFDRVVRVAIAHGSDDPAVRKELFSKVHQAVPDIMEEVEVVSNFVGNVRAQVPSVGISTNPADQYGEKSVGSVQLPAAGAEESQGDEKPVREENIAVAAADPNEFVGEFTL